MTGVPAAMAAFTSGPSASGLASETPIPSEAEATAACMSWTCFSGSLLDGLQTISTPNASAASWAPFLTTDQKTPSSEWVTIWKVRSMLWVGVTATVVAASAAVVTASVAAVVASSGAASSSPPQAANTKAKTARTAAHRFLCIGSSSEPRVRLDESGQEDARYRARASPCRAARNHTSKRRPECPRTASGFESAPSSDPKCRAESAP